MVGARRHLHSYCNRTIQVYSSMLVLLPTTILLSVLIPHSALLGKSSLGGKDTGESGGQHTLEFPHFGVRGTSPVKDGHSCLGLQVPFWPVGVRQKFVCGFGTTLLAGGSKTGASLGQQTLGFVLSLSTLQRDCLKYVAVWLVRLSRRENKNEHCLRG